jgi:hypothetical protein
MKTAPFCGAALAVAGIAFAADTSAEQMPQPRPRLVIPGTTASGIVPSAAKTGNVTVTLPKVVVSDRALSRDPERLTESKGAFTPADGGSLLQSDRNGTVFELGLWRWENVDQEGEKFRPAKTRVDMEVMRVRW